LQHRASAPSGRGAAPRVSRYPAFEPDTPVPAAARAIARTLLAAAMLEAPAVLRGDDAKVIHDMRVAIRRLRCALDTFRDHFPRKRLRRFARDVRRLGRRLGAVRDADVQLAALRATANPASGEERDGTAFAIAWIEARRRRDLGLFAEELARFDPSGLERLTEDD
jgi:CHAD domain-containing protein